MDSLQIYKLFLLKINKNDTSANINVSKGEFVLLYNEQKKVWLEEKIKNKTTDIDIHDLEKIYTKDKKLTKKSFDINSTSFNLPDNFFKFDSSFCIAKKDKCEERVLINWLVKPKNVNIYLTDTNHEPSFEYEETFSILSDNSLVIYTKDFKINHAYLSYYKEPKNIDLEGYIKIDGSKSNTINQDDLDDKSINEIINRCVIETIRIYENPEGFQLAQNRIQNEN